MEFVLQLLAQLFSGPVEDLDTAVKKDIKPSAAVETERIEEVSAELQIEPNFFNLMDFH